MTPSHRVWIALGGLLLVAPICSAAEPAARPVNVSPGIPVGTLISEVAVAAEDLALDQAPLLIGRALESSSERGESTVRTLVGLPETATLAGWDGDLASEVGRLQTQIESQQEALSQMRAQLARLGRRVNR